MLQAKQLNSKIQPRLTHTETLTLDAPKSRRRIRRLLNVRGSTHRLAHSDMTNAQFLANDHEKKDKPKPRKLKI